MPAPLGSTSANACSPVPERASREGLGEGTNQPLLEGLAPVCASLQGGHVVIEHDRNAGRGLPNSLALAMGSFLSHETDGFSLLKHNTINISYTSNLNSFTKNTNTLSLHVSPDNGLLRGQKVGQYINTINTSPLSANPPKSGRTQTGEEISQLRYIFSISAHITVNTLNDRYPQLLAVNLSLIHI